MISKWWCVSDLKRERTVTWKLLWNGEKKREGHWMKLVFTLQIGIGLFSFKEESMLFQMKDIFYAYNGKLAYKSNSARNRDIGIWGGNAIQIKI